MLPHRLQAICVLPDRFPIDGVPFDISIHLSHNSFHRWRNVDNIVTADNQSSDTAYLTTLDNLFCLVQNKVHMDIVPLQYAPKFPAALEGDDYWLPVQHLIQNIQRPFGHNRTHF